MIFIKPTPLYTTQYPDLFITYKEGFKIHIGKRNPFQLPESEQYNKLTAQLISGKLKHTHDKFLFPALNSLNNFDTIDYEAQLIQLILTLNIQLTTYSEACLLLKSILFILFAKLNAPNS